MTRSIDKAKRPERTERFCLCRDRRGVFQDDHIGGSRRFRTGFFGDSRDQRQQERDDGRYDPPPTACTENPDIHLFAPNDSTANVLKSARLRCSDALSFPFDRDLLDSIGCRSLRRQWALAPASEPLTCSAPSPWAQPNQEKTHLNCTAPPTLYQSEAGSKDHRLRCSCGT